VLDASLLTEPAFERAFSYLAAVFRQIGETATGDSGNIAL